jgi:hypothetical protein
MPVGVVYFSTVQIQNVYKCQETLGLLLKSWQALGLNGHEYAITMWNEDIMYKFYSDVQMLQVHTTAGFSQRGDLNHQSLHQ